MAVTSVLMAVSLLPLLKLPETGRKNEKNTAAPFKAVWAQRGQMFRLLFPSLLVSLGAGLLIPFMNLFFRNRFGLDDNYIGQLIGFGSLGMGIAFLAAPVLADRWGKARAVVITQGLSIPFMILLGFVPNLTVAFIAYFIRMALMNLSSPIYQTMVMEEVEDDARGMAASLYSMIWNFGRALSPIISGPIQMHYGFDPIFVATILTYGVSVWMLWVWFVRGRARHPASLPALAEQ
jgi:MFS family permease